MIVDFSMRAVIIGIVIIVFLSLYRIVLGPHATDRVVGTNVVMTNIVLAIILLAHIIGDYTYLDVAFVYVLSSFVGTICVMKGLGKGKLS
ncbi:MAG: monovalent cation/H+ antiporter complex subunit F [Firmicutes bacterium]|nr:monovalent cation/H+ antiporter complex subunit F [Bacillota bacterium]